MQMNIEPTLYVDDQAAAHRAQCPVCGGCLYSPSLRCLRCQRRAQV